MNVIFTDVDGVLNNPIILKQKGSVSFDDECLAQFVRLVQRTSGSVVVTSSWRLSTDKMDFLRAQFTQAGIIGQLLGQTPDLGDVASRAREIQHWLNSNPSVTSFVILDTFYGAQLKNNLNSFHNVNEERGLTCWDVDRILEYFNLPILP
jgi:hypothetical protein